MKQSLGIDPLAEPDHPSFVMDDPQNLPRLGMDLGDQQKAGIRSQVDR
jgi:hypothetical protein